MKVSIIVPVYNAEKYLAKCADSLVNQTLDDYEVIFVNDGSKDSSEAILKDYESRYPEKVRVVTVENGGQGRARNIGISMARGEFLGFADSDDWVDAAMFEKLYDAASEPGVDMAVCDVIECWDDGHTVYSPLSQFDDPMSVTTAVWNKLFRKSLAEGIEFPQGLWYEDLAYVIRLMIRVKKYVPVQEGLYFYRCGQTSTMNNNNSKKNLDMIKILEGLKPDMLSAGRKEDFEAIVISHCLLDTVNRVAAHSSEDRKRVIKELRDYVHENVPTLLGCKAYKRESTKRKIIMFLNYYGLENVSKLIFSLKNAI